jgi:hypothetical protein
MLTEAPPGHFHAACEKCRAVHRFTAKDVESARMALGTLGWMEAAVKARKRERWLWWCPECKPKPTYGVKGRSTI